MTDIELTNLQDRLAQKLRLTNGWVSILESTFEEGYGLERSKKGKYQFDHNHFPTGIEKIYDYLEAICDMHKQIKQVHDEQQEEFIETDEELISGCL